MADEIQKQVIIHGLEHIGRVNGQRPKELTTEEILRAEEIRLGVKLTVVKKEGSDG